MIIGSGIDLVEINRMEKIIKKWGNNFIFRIFTAAEKKYCEKRKGGKYQSYAGKFAGKEALLKALGLGLREVSWKEIEISNDELGQPIINTSGKLKDIASKKGVCKYFISISHSKEHAIAQVILEGLLDK